MQSHQTLRARKLGLTTSHGVPSPTSSKMTWVPTWRHFLEARRVTCVKSWVKQKARPDFASMLGLFDMSGT